MARFSTDAPEFMARGSKGPVVVIVKKFLGDWFLYNQRDPPGFLSGDNYSNTTYLAMQIFQESVGLPPSGNLDPDTLMKMCGIRGFDYYAHANRVGPRLTTFVDAQGLKFYWCPGIVPSDNLQSATLAMMDAHGVE